MRFTVRSAVSTIPRLRKVLLALGSFVILFGVACSRETKEGASETRPAAQINAAEIKLANLRLIPEADRQSFGVAGEVQNNSPKYTLTEVQLQVVLQDCTETDCQNIGEQVATIPTNVPAGQARDIQAQVRFEDLPEPQGKLGFRYSVVGTKASEPE